jgi:membrane protein DedA with SNARE-associated domain
MKPWLRWTILMAILLALILVPFALWEDSLTFLSMQLLSPVAGRMTVAGVVVLLLAADVVLPVPSSFVSAGAVSLLGAYEGGISIALGMTLGAWLGYLIGRFGGEPLARRVAGEEQLAKAGRLMERYGAWVVLVCRGVPVLAEASTVLAGATRVSVLRFALVTLLGNAGLACAYALIDVLHLSGVWQILAPFGFGIAVPGLAILALRRA